ncbi:hypothetical protein POY60_13970, partial [Phocaeicola vulgatus]|nr:hypothetical protein [Phocaeicola vulgatus]
LVAMRQCDMKWRTGSYYHKGNSKVCSVLLRIISAALYLFRKSLRSRVSNERKITQINIFFARRDGWSRPLPLGVPRPMSFLVIYHNFVFLKY